jgi:deoxycytidylate deaminase
MSQDAGQGPNRKQFDADCLIVGFTGSLGSGCTFLAEGVADKLGKHGHYYRLSQFLSAEARKRNIAETVQNLQSLGDELRLRNRNSILVEKCLDQIKCDNEKSGFTQDEETVLLIDGIKNGGEVKYLRQFPNFYLVSVYANQPVRQDRLVGGGAPYRRFDTSEEFLLADRRDEQEDFPHGQQIKRCNYVSDIIVDNSTPLPEAKVIERNKSFNDFINDYIHPMRKVRKGEKAYDRPPKIEETLMTMAYCASKRSSCLKRQVGAVIACVRKIKDEYPEADCDRDERDPPFQIVSSGYNDIPAGSPCVFSDWGGCYRDSLLQKHAKVVKYCPNCGRALPEELACPHCETPNTDRALECPQCGGDLLADYKCPNKDCEFRVFSVCLPGEEGVPGKLLDMCRALHAEENAILGLSALAKSGRGELVLYTTTYPCNLCANKIIAAGIKTVYYAEAYTMKEAKELFDKIGVNVTKFEGIKSSAYFRLYA